MKPRTAIAVLCTCALAWVAMAVARTKLAVRAPAVPDAASRHATAGTRAVVRLPDVAGALGHAAGAVFGWLGGWVSGGKVPLIVVAALLVGGWLVRVVRIGVRLRSTEQDPQRMFSAEQRREAFGRADNRCEYTGMLGRRCRSAAEHADHAFPWTLGGATSLDNCVASCARHNLSKGAKVLTRHQVRSLERRRRGYFPPGSPLTVERRYVDAAISLPAASSSSHRPAFTRGSRGQTPIAADRSAWAGDDSRPSPAAARATAEVDESALGW